MSNSHSPSAEQRVAEPVARPTPAPEVTIAAVSRAPARAKPAAAGKTITPLASKAKMPRARAPVPAKPVQPVAKALNSAASMSSAKAGTGKPAKEGKHSGKKPSLVRDSFTFPALDYAQIGTLKQRALKAGHQVRKNEVLRAGLAALSALSDAALLKALQAIERLPPGRPGK
jgi:hypothetical protein